MVVGHRRPSAAAAEASEKAAAVTVVAVFQKCSSAEASEKAAAVTTLVTCPCPESELDLAVLVRSNRLVV